MRQQQKFGCALNHPRGTTLLLIGDAIRYSWGWRYVGMHWGTGEKFKCLSEQWWPTNIVVVTDHISDIDAFWLDKQRTMWLNPGLTQEWLDENEPGTDSPGQLLLWPID